VRALEHHPRAQAVAAREHILDRRLQVRECRPQHRDDRLEAIPPIVLTRPNLVLDEIGTNHLVDRSEIATGEAVLHHTPERRNAIVCHNNLLRLRRRVRRGG
jgi:hypothetical protein